jgi:hypothetical protein
MSDEEAKAECPVTHTVYLPKDIQVGQSPSEYLVSSARVETKGAHDNVFIWCRGGFSGLCVVAAGEGPAFVEMLGLVHRACPACGNHGPENKEGGDGHVHEEVG